MFSVNLFIFCFSTQMLHFQFYNIKCDILFHSRITGKLNIFRDPDHRPIATNHPISQALQRMVRMAPSLVLDPSRGLSESRGLLQTANPRGGDPLDIQNLFLSLSIMYVPPP